MDELMNKTVQYQTNDNTLYDLEEANLTAIIF